MVLNKQLFNKYILLFLSIIILSCSASLSYIAYKDQQRSRLRSGNYEQAFFELKHNKEAIYSSSQDRLLYLLDRGQLEHYRQNWSESNRYLNRAEEVMEELFTQSLSQLAGSYILNDNIVDYGGEVYEHLYVNVFKALNYSAQGQNEDALVEIRKVDLKLQQLEDQLAESFKQLTSEQKIKADLPAPFYSDVLAHYLSALFYLHNGQQDEARIAVQKLKQAWHTQPHIYTQPLPAFLDSLFTPEKPVLNLICFTGNAPTKVVTGGMITTYKDYIGINDLSLPVALPNIPFPGAEPGYHFKFELPELESFPSQIKTIRVRTDHGCSTTLSLLEDMGQVAQETFKSKETFLYIKTVMRAVAKGLGAAEAKKKLKNETDADPILGAFIDAVVDVGVDATEQADLRCWDSLPQKCFAGTIPLANAAKLFVTFLDASGNVVEKRAVTITPDIRNRVVLELISLK